VRSEETGEETGADVLVTGSGVLEADVFYC